MKLPPSRLLARLDAELARCRQPVQAACLRAERAGFLARLGHFDQAKAELDALQAQFEHQPNAAVSAWLCLAQGWMLNFSNLSGTARDKMKRAQALSAAAGLMPLHALSSAWLAHMDYMADYIDDMVANVSLALGHAAADHHAARARACMVMALAYHFCERLDRAKPWYARARQHATLDGDETTLSALNYNITSNRAHHALQAAVFGGGNPLDDARQALAGYECTSNFDEWIGTLSLDALVPVQQASLASIQGQYGRALTMYERHLADAQKQGLARLAPTWRADVAWCRWHAGDTAGARRDAQTAAAGIDATMHHDDRATAHGRLSQVFRLLGDPDTAERHAQLAGDFLAQHRKFQHEVLERLERSQLQP